MLRIETNFLGWRPFEKTLNSNDSKIHILRYNLNPLGVSHSKIHILNLLGVRVRDEGTRKEVRDREMFEIEGSRDREKVHYKSVMLSAT